MSFLDWFVGIDVDGTVGVVLVVGAAGPADVLVDAETGDLTLDIPLAPEEEA